MVALLSFIPSASWVFSKVKVVRISRSARTALRVLEEVFDAINLYVATDKQEIYEHGLLSNPHPT